MDVDLVSPLAPKIFLKVTFYIYDSNPFYTNVLAGGIKQLLRPFKNPTTREILYHTVHHIATNQGKNEPGAR